MTASEMISALRAEKINTWFDLGLFLDKIKDDRKNPNCKNYSSFSDFKADINQGGMAFISFFFSVDGASMECEKYVKALKKVIGNFNVHYIAGKFYETGYQFLDPDSKHVQFDELLPFDDWDLYHDFFFEKLERGSDTYNSLIKRFWKQVLTICENLANYFEQNKIRLLCLVNTNSNPGNVSEALALVLISEYMGIPVISNNHDFYWEGGNSEIDILEKKLATGPRDHFFKNYHLGEIFSLLEVIYPWESRSWFSLNINEKQTTELVDFHGHNPANVCTIDTCVDTAKFNNGCTAQRRTEILTQIADIFSDDGRNIAVQSISTFETTKYKSCTDLKPFLFSNVNSIKRKDFCNDNMIFLQPTRILKRKAIEIDFQLVSALLQDSEVIEQFENNKNLKLTILVTGPVAIGQIDVFFKLIKEFSHSLKTVPKRFQERIFLGFLFSAFDKNLFKKSYSQPFTLPELYKIAALILLPSETEGRGLPIIEAAACGMPVFCRRYYPEYVFDHVIGENLPKTERIFVAAFKENNLDHDVIEIVKQMVFAPKTLKDYNERNKEVVARRFSFESLAKNFHSVLYRLYIQMQSGSKEMVLAEWAIEEYQNHLSRNKHFVQTLIENKNRQYLPGYGQMLFMLMLKSLIDPSYFRVEEKRIRGMAMQFARELVENTPDPSPPDVDIVNRFYNAVDSLFHYHNGEMDIRLDHSFTYRHRNRVYFPYRDFTPQELTGVINLLYNRLTAPPPVIKIGGLKEISRDWYKNLSHLYDQAPLAIDHTDDLEDKLKQNIPLALFPGKFIELELELFILAPVRHRLKLKHNEKIDDGTVKRRKLAPFFIIQHEKPLGNSVTADVLKSYVFYSGNSELLTLFNYGICKIIASKQLSVGFHLYGIGHDAAEALKKIKNKKGVMITSGDHATMMTDIIDIDRFHIGKVSNTFVAKILGIPENSGYVQWVPAGLRFTLAYPTPIQTGKDFSKILKGFRFKKLADEMGKQKILDSLRKDALNKSSPINLVLNSLETQKVADTRVSSSPINGVYGDGMPWSGAMAHVSMQQGQPWKYSVVVTRDKPKTVVKFLEEFNIENKTNARVAWNGGYILNPELVGKLGIPETFIGSPLGLIISDGVVQCPPLFNKAAFLVQQDGKLEIKRVNSSKGITISDNKSDFVFPADSYNQENPSQKMCYYDLLYPFNSIPGNGRIIVRLAGNFIKDIIRTKNTEDTPVLPVGLVLSFAVDAFPKDWKVGQQLNIKMNDWPMYISAIEAGPQLLNKAKGCLDMKEEGWKTQNSINTQAARLDFTDMRGPKIAIGIDAHGDLFVLTVNGRIRESVGATHYDMADILRKQGMVQAMGFDPGGSSTLVVDGKTLNISPYNHQYEKDVYSLPPEPRAVANALIVW